MRQEERNCFSQEVAIIFDAGVGGNFAGTAGHWCPGYVGSRFPILPRQFFSAGNGMRLWLGGQGRQQGSSGGGDEVY